MADLDIAEVAQRAGVTAATLRYYEEKGLIAATGRRGLRRQFDPGVLQRLALIALGRAAGFSLDEIARMFAPDGQPRIDRQLLTAKAQELDATIRKLSVLRDSLRHAAACPAPSHLECRTFRRILRAVASGAVAVGGRERGRHGEGLAPHHRAGPAPAQPPGAGVAGATRDSQSAASLAGSVRSRRTSGRIAG